MDNYKSSELLRLVNIADYYTYREDSNEELDIICDCAAKILNLARLYVSSNRIRNRNRLRGKSLGKSICNFFENSKVWFEDYVNYYDKVSYIERLKVALDTNALYDYILSAFDKKDDLKDVVEALVWLKADIYDKELSSYKEPNSEATKLLDDYPEAEASKFFDIPESSDMAFDLACNIVFDYYTVLSISRSAPEDLLKSVQKAQKVADKVADEINLIPSCKSVFYDFADALRDNSYIADADCLEFFADLI